MGVQLKYWGGIAPVPTPLSSRNNSKLATQGSKAEMHIEINMPSNEMDIEYSIFVIVLAEVHF